MRIGNLLIDLGLRGYLVRAGILPQACGEVLNEQDNPTPIPLAEIPRGRRTIVALVAGQSNAANGGQGRCAATPGVFNFYNGQSYIARDPLLGASGNGGSPWVRLGRRLIETGRYDAVILVPVAVGGTRIGHWAPGGELHPMLLAAVDQVHAADLKVTHMIWHQGESDVEYGTSRTAYTKCLRAMMNALRRRGMAAPTLVCRVSTMRDAISPEIRRAQEKIIATMPNVFAGPDTDLLLGADDRFDRLHFSETGLEAFADALFTSILTIPDPTEGSSSF